MSDPTVKPLGSVTGAPSSPRRLLVSTLGDELKMSSLHRKGAEDAPRVFGVSLRIDLNDLAPTLATLAGVEIPAGSVGRVLTEALRPLADRPRRSRQS